MLKPPTVDTSARRSWLPMSGPARRPSDHAGIRDHDAGFGDHNVGIADHHAGTGDHDGLELAITFDWNARSQWAGLRSLRQTRHFMRTCGHFGLATVAAGMPVVEAFAAANGGPVDREDLLAIPMNPGSAVKTEGWTSRPSSIVALQHRDFRLLWLGLLISFSGSTMQTTAILWHVSVLVP